MLRNALGTTILGIAILLQGHAVYSQTTRTVDATGSSDSAEFTDLTEPTESGTTPTGLKKLSNSVNQFGKEVNQFGKNLVGLVKPKDRDKEEKQRAAREQQEQEFSPSRAGSAFNRYRDSSTGTSKNPRNEAPPFLFPEKPTPDSELKTIEPVKAPPATTSNSRPQSEIRLYPEGTGPLLQSPNAGPRPQLTVPGESGTTYKSPSTYDSPSTYNSPSTSPSASRSTSQPSASSYRLTSPSVSTNTKTQKPQGASSQGVQPSDPQLPLHQRLRSLKQSPFQKSYIYESNQPQAESQPSSGTLVEPTRAGEYEPTRVDQYEEGPQPTRADGLRPTQAAEPQPTLVEPESSVSRIRMPGSDATPDSGYPSSHTPFNPRSSTARVEVGASRSTSLARDQILLRRDSPILNVQTVGPSKINIGREAKYKVILKNQADMPAYEVLVTVELPEWAEVISAEAEQGTAAIDRSTTSRRLCWRLDVLPGNARHEMTLRLIPRERRPIELAVRSSFTQVTSQAVIEVQEPQLAMRLVGPREIPLGKPELFKIEINNTGNGPAEDMILTLLPLTKQGLPTTHRLGNLEAGTRRTIDLELTAQQFENIAVEADLKCNASTGAQLIEKLTVLAPDIKAGVFGPAVRFLNTRGLYQIKVSNHGNLEARNVEVQTVIPQEAKLLRGSEGIRFNQRSNTVVWTIDSLMPNTERTFEIECEMVEQGTARFVIGVKDGKYTELNKIASIRVESMADLTMEIVDPKGPVSVGEEAAYEIHIRNRGTRPAEMVSAVAYFSDGIEPVAASGMKHRITPGQVAFQTIGAIAPNDLVVLKVQAVAGKSGNHMFRAETECKSLGTTLIGEETTHFYQGSTLADTELQSDTAPSSQPQPQTVDRRNEPIINPSPYVPLQR